MSKNVDGNFIDNRSSGSSGNNKLVRNVSTTATPNINVVADQDAHIKSNLMRSNASNAASYEINRLQQGNTLESRLHDDDNINIANIADKRFAANQQG